MKTIEDLFNYLLENALIAGININEYWELTLLEIKTIIKAYNKKNEDNYKYKLTMNYELARNTAAFVGCILSGNSIPSFNEIYANVFPVDEETRKKQTDMYKDMFKCFAEHHNAIRHNKEVNT